MHIVYDTVATKINTVVVGCWLLVVKSPIQSTTYRYDLRYRQSHNIYFMSQDIVENLCRFYEAMVQAEDDWFVV